MLPQPRLDAASIWMRLVLVLVVLASLGVAGCAGKKKPSPAPPPQAFHGPRFLHGTIGSMVGIRGYDYQLVSGYGLVVGLPFTGSREVPQFLRPWLINEMRKHDLGRSPTLEDLGPRYSPTMVLNSGQASPVVVEGLIPPGATKGTRFDVLISALPQTETTSLEGGQLWTFELAEGGANPEMRYRRPIARAHGPMYLNPFEQDADVKKRLLIERQAVILSGGEAITNRSVDLILNEPSYQRARLIADRINEKFPLPNATEFRNTAQALSDQRIALEIPPAFQVEPERFLALISHLFVQRAVNFEPDKARQLAHMLEAQSAAQSAADVALCWETLGKTALPVIRDYYAHPKMPIRMAALEAGAHLGDMATLGFDNGEEDRGRLLDAARSTEAAIRRQAANQLALLPKSLRGARTLHALLDDDDRSVRIAAYESMARIGDPEVLRMRRIFGDPGEFKFVLDVVEAKKPMIYITHQDVPRVVIFNPMLSFKLPILASIWDNRLMVRAQSLDELADVYYMPPNESEGKTLQIAPVLANLVVLLASTPEVENKYVGFDLTFSRVVNALYQLHAAGFIDADLEVRINPLAEAIARSRGVNNQPRPETAPATKPVVEPEPGMGHNQPASGSVPRRETDERSEVERQNLPFP